MVECSNQQSKHLPQQKWSREYIFEKDIKEQQWQETGQLAKVYCKEKPQISLQNTKCKKYASYYIPSSFVADADAHEWR